MAETTPVTTTQTGMPPAHKWEHNEDGTLKLTAEFKARFVQNIKGRDVVLFNGLLALAHQKGIKSLTTDLIQSPKLPTNFLGPNGPEVADPGNGNTAIVKSRLVGWDKDPTEKNKKIEVVYEGIGDATPSNCSSIVAGAFIRMADTRALSRVLRWYTNIGMLTAEEIDSPTEQFGGPIVPTLDDFFITPTQMQTISFLVNLCGFAGNDAGMNTAKTICTNVTGKQSTRDLKIEQANAYISALLAYYNQSTGSPAVTPDVSAPSTAPAAPQPPAMQAPEELSID